MSKKVSINYNDQNFELDLVKGSENENGIDISSLRNISYYWIIFI